MSGRVSAILRSWRRDRRGVAAVEFAFTVPVLLVVYMAGFELSQAMAAYRKLSDATVELANITAQYTKMNSGDVSSVMNASAQIMAPCPTANLTIVLSEVTTDAANNATVTWSQASGGASALTAGSSIALPAGLGSPGTSYILVQTTYRYDPIIGGHFISAIPMTDQIYMVPRASSAIPYTAS